MAAATGVTPAATQPDTARTRTLAQRAVDRVPVKWLGTGMLALFLAATAGFGGLAGVKEPEVPVLAAGESFVGAELEMTPVRLAVLDELHGSAVYPADGQRVLVLTMDVRNLSEFARMSAVDGSVAEVRIAGVEDVAPTIVRLDDETISPWLQPLVPARIALAWPVPADAFADGDEAQLLLPTATRYVGQSVVYGVYWDDITVAGHMDLAVEDLGTGEDPA